mmetsp:Transcript_27837/g.70969  ORF Transcript_27837/g.70969 Transcript_27837/m.70969 type:complete len:203 (+) Transcript_27837:84-692(+)
MSQCICLPTRASLQRQGQLAGLQPLLHRPRAAIHSRHRSPVPAVQGLRPGAMPSLQPATHSLPALAGCWMPSRRLLRRPLQPLSQASQRACGGRRSKVSQQASQPETDLRLSQQGLEVRQDGLGGGQPRRYPPPPSPLPPPPLQPLGSSTHHLGPALQQHLPRPRLMAAVAPACLTGRTSWRCCWRRTQTYPGCRARLSWSW